MNSQTRIRNSIVAVAVALAALLSVATAGAKALETSLDPWAVGLVQQYQASGGGLDPWAVGLVRRAASERRAAPAGAFDPWAVGLVQQYQASGGGLDPWAVGLVQQSSDRFAARRTVQPAVASARNGSAGFSFGAAAIGAALLAVFVIGGSAVAVRRRHHHTPQLSGP